MVLGVGFQRLFESRDRPAGLTALQQQLTLRPADRSELSAGLEGGLEGLHRRLKLAAPGPDLPLGHQDFCAAGGDASRGGQQFAGDFLIAALAGGSGRSEQISVIRWVQGAGPLEPVSGLLHLPQLKRGLRRLPQGLTRISPRLEY